MKIKPTYDERDRRVAELEDEIATLRKVEEELSESEKAYRDLVENISEIVYATDENGIVTYVSPAVKKIGGYDPSEITGRPFTDFVYHEDLEGRMIHLGKILLGAGEPTEYRYLTKSGEVRWVKTMARPITEGERVTGIRGVLTDITDLKNAQKRSKDYARDLERMVEDRTKELHHALKDTQDARDWIDGIVKSIADGLIVTDNLNRIVLVNRAAEDILDIRLSEVVNQSVYDAIGNTILREKIAAPHTDDNADNQFYMELPGTHPRRPRILCGRTSTIEDQEGKKGGVITTIQDVTYEREVDQMKTQFITTAAHELRTPLTSILGFSEILVSRGDIAEEEKKKYLSYINQQSHNLANIVSDLLDISRIESGLGVSLKKEPADLGEIITDAVRYFREQSPRHTFEVTIPDNSFEVSADRLRIRQALENILSNAVKFSPYGGVIHIRGSISKGWCHVSVQDEGVGMVPEQVEMVFDKFFRASDPAVAVDGTGLGMTMVKYIIEAHGGTVSVESEPDKGTTVTFVVPL